MGYLDYRMRHFNVDGHAACRANAQANGLALTKSTLAIECFNCHRTTAWRKVARELVLVICPLCGTPYRLRDWLKLASTGRLVGGVSGVDDEERRCSCGVCLTVRQADVEFLQREVP